MLKSIYSIIHGIYKMSRVRYFFIGFSVCFFLIFTYDLYSFISSLPDPRDIGRANYSTSTHIYDRRGRLLYEVYHDENRSPIKITELPQYVIDATIAIEDKDFYKHSGISPVSGVMRAIRDSLLNNQLQGGSTITQQLVKLSLLSSERTVTRKLKEAVLAIQVERIYDKNKILEFYLNQVPYGGSIYGIEEAAESYFGKKPKQLTLSEIAMIAGLPQSPTGYSPYVNPGLNRRRRDDVLRAMLEQGYIDKKIFDKSIKEKLTVRPAKELIRSPHFVFYAKKELEEQFGVTQVATGGLSVITSLDLDLQLYAEKILKDEIDKLKHLNVTNGAVLITRPKTGEILSMVGSVDYFATPSGAFNVVTAARQPGSSIKPIMYSLALSKGYTAASIIDDIPTSFPIKGGPTYKPVNYDGRFHGKVSLRYALANSYNIPAVKVLSGIGVNNLVDYGRNLGIDSWKDPQRYGLALTLGGGEVTMIEMATAMGVMANSGSKVDLTSLLEVRDSVGMNRPLPPKYNKQVMDPAVSYIISDILSDNVARRWAFGNNSALEIPKYKVAVKTGTTDLKKDNWTIGYTPEYLVAVWVGNNDNTPMNKQLTSGITGAAPIWNKIMSYLLMRSNHDQVWFSQPENVVTKKCLFGRVEYFIKGTENNQSCMIVPSISLTPAPRGFQLRTNP